MTTKKAKKKTAAAKKTENTSDLPRSIKVAGKIHYLRSPERDLNNLLKLADRLESEAKGLLSIELKDTGKLQERLKRVAVDIKKVRKAIESQSCDYGYSPSKKR